MSSDRKGSVGDAATQESTSTAATTDNGLGQVMPDDGTPEDPWFTPGPKTASVGETSTVELGTGEASTGLAGRVQEAEWFLRTGRAGLHPDSVTSIDDAAEALADHREVRVTAAGAPPWAGETTDASASTPPPWETGPWPGPGDPTARRLRPVGDGDGEAALLASSAVATGLTGRTALAGAELDGTGPDAAPVRWAPRTVLTAGLLPLVVPGLVVGFLSLRQAGGDAIRRAAWLAIAASVVWALIIIVVVASVSGGAASSCTSYPAAVHQAYEKVLTDLNGHAPASVQAADLVTAASLANSSAAAAGQIGVRTGLFTMANDMVQARADVVAGRPIPGTLRQHLADDGVVPAGSCTG